MNFAIFTYLFQVLWRVPSILHLPNASFSKISKFEVHSLPGISSIPTSWAGRLPVPGLDEGNEVFFWLFEAEDQHYDDNLIRA